GSAGGATAGGIGAEGWAPTGAFSPGNPRPRVRDRPPRGGARADGARGRPGGRRLGGGGRRLIRSEGGMTYEEAEKELTQIVEQLERGDAGLDEALKLWERGEELYRFCAGHREAAEE